jgi:hypothetical protein
VGAAQVVDEANERWINGVAFRTHPCGPALGYSVCGGSGGISKAAGDGPGQIGGDAGVQPVVIYLPVECTVRYGDSFGDLRDLAVVAFNVYELAAFEREFWAGTIEPGNQRLASPDAVSLNAGAATSPSNALSLLEQAIADSGAAGVIHCTPRVATRWAHTGGLSAKGGRLVTPLGTTVVPGYGYPGTGPDGSDPGTGKSWAYATGPVQLRRSKVTVLPDIAAEAILRPTNTVTITVERAYLSVRDECLHAAVQVDPCMTTC